MSEPENLTRQSAFAYQCNQCNRCCRHYSIKVNPYEISRLAANRGITTTEFIAGFTTDQGTVLKRDTDGACAFLGKQGCTVHPDRPLVCRLYPLGRVDTQAEGERFHRIDLVPGSLGLFTDRTSSVADPPPTVQDYLDSQGADPYVEAVDAYNRLLVKMLSRLREMEAESVQTDDSVDLTLLMDTDACLAAEGWTSAPGPEARMHAHIQCIENWLCR